MFNGIITKLDYLNSERQDVSDRIFGTENL